MLALVGWTQAGYIPGTGMWWLHCAAYVFVWLIGLLVVAVVYVAASNAYPTAALLAPLAYLGITFFLFWERRQQVKAGGNLRLLVTDEFVVRFESQEHRLFRRVSFRRTNMSGDLAWFGVAIRRVRLKRRSDHVWELRLNAGFWRSFLIADSLRIGLRCSEEEARALAQELRLRVARAVEREAHK